MSADPDDDAAHDALKRTSSILTLSTLPGSSFGMDIGGSLAKICFYDKMQHVRTT